MDMCLHKFDIYQGISAETLDVLISFEKKKFCYSSARQHFFENLFSPGRKKGSKLTNSCLQCYIKRIQTQLTRFLIKEKSY